MEEVRVLIDEGLKGVSSDCEVATRLTAAIVEGYEGVPADHSMNHIRVVARNALGAVMREYSPVEKLVLIIAALAHDIEDSKFERYIERWERFVVALKQIFEEIGLGEYARWVIFIVNHVGVSKEATRSYSVVRSQEEWRRLAAEVTERWEILLEIRHTVSSADIVEALGEHGHERAVTHNSRLCKEEVGTPEHTAEVFKGVTWVHREKHAKLCRWIHNPTLRKEAIARWDGMVSAYRVWAKELGFEPEELTLIL